MCLIVNLSYQIMLTLYYKPTCPFGRRVLAVVARLKLEVELKDVADKEEYALELLERVGQKKALCLVDTEQSTELCESDDIVCHLQKHYGLKSQPTRPRVSVSESVCVACEG